MRTGFLFVGSIVLAFAIWQFLSSFVFNPFLIPPPLVVFKTAVPMVESGEIFRHVAISLARVGVGFIFDRLFRMAVDRMLSRYMSYIALT